MITVVFNKPFKRQPHKSVKNTQTIRRLLPTNCLSVSDHFVGLALKGLTSDLENLLFFRANKESWIQAKYVDKKFTSKVRNQNHLPNGERRFKRKNVVRKKSDGRLRAYSLERVDVLDLDNPVHLKVTPTSSYDSADTASDDDPETASLHPNMVLT